MVTGTKTGGRQKGTPNKITTHLIKILEQEGFNPAVNILKEIKQDKLITRVKNLEKEIEELEDQAEEMQEKINSLKSKSAQEKNAAILVKHNKKLNRSRTKLEKLERKVLSTKERIDISFKFMEYVYPKRRAIEGSLDVGVKTVSEVLADIVDGVDGTTKRGTDK